MSADAIRQAIQATMEAVPGVGIVHLYERYTVNAKELADFYKADGKLLGWHIRRVAASEGRIGGEVLDGVSYWRITGYRALNDGDESELEFDRLLDALMEAFRADPKLGGAVVTTWVGDTAGLQLIDAGPVLFAGVLCHKAVLGLAAQALCPINGNGP